MTDFVGKNETWKLGDEIGHGGQGNAFYATCDKNHNKLYILKKPKAPAEKLTEKQKQRFDKETLACLGLSHPNILKIVDFGVQEGVPFYVSEYFPAGSLDSSEMKAYTNLQKLYIFRDLCKAVACTHKNNIIHRDIKPGNILLKSDKITPVLADFGICYDLKSEDRVTRTNENVGSKYFIAPELSRGRSEKITPAADIYSMGKLLYWMFSNGNIFDREAHHKPQYDLTKQNKPEIHLVYKLLDLTVVEDPKKRLSDGNKILQEVEKIIHQIKSTKIMGLSENLLARKLKPFDSYLGLLDVSKDGKQVLLSQADKIVIIDVTNQSIQKEIPISGKIAKFLPDKSKILAAYVSIDVYDIEKNEQVSSFFDPSSLPDYVVASMDENWIISGSKGNIRIWNTQTQQERASFQAHKINLYSIALSKDEKYLFTAGGEYSSPEVKMWDYNDFNLIHTFSGYKLGIKDLAVSPDNSFLLVCDGNFTGEVKCYGLEKKAQWEGLRKGSITGNSAVAISPNGNRILTGHMDSSIFLWDKNNFEPVCRLKGQSRVEAVCFAGKKSEYAVSICGDGEAYIWHLPGE